MRETIIAVRCDACDSRGKHTKLDGTEQVTVDLGDGPFYLDLCKTDRKALIDPLAALITGYGVPVDARGRTKPVAAKPGSDEQECPRCGDVIMGSRRSLIGHVVNRHAMDAVAASKLVPPANGKSVPCPVCGYITDGGTGFGGHIRPVHGDDVWKKIKEEM